MAQYWEDWSGSTLSSPPTGWTARWSAINANYTVEAETDPAAPAGRRLRIAISSGNNRRILSMDAVDSDADRGTFEIAMLVRNQAYGSNSIGILGVGRASGTASNEHASGVGVARVSGVQRLRSAQYTSGSAAFPGGDGATLAGLDNGEYYWMKISVVGTAITAGMYAVDDLVTPVATHTATLASAAGAGWIGIMTFLGGLSYDVAAVGIGTNGDPAPTSEPSPVDPPEGTVTITDVTPGIIAAVVTYSYDDSDADSFHYRLNGGAPAAIGASPAPIAGLSPATEYDLQVRAINAGGPGDWSSIYPFETSEAGAPIKGLRLQLFNAAGAPAASITDIQVAWFDAAEPKDFSAPAYKSSAAATDASGWLVIDLDAATSLDIDDIGFLLVYNLDVSDSDDSWVFAGAVPVSDVS